MRGECDKCGEHCLDCICNADYVCPDAIKSYKMQWMQWISVEDRLPDILCMILVSFDNIVDTAYYNNESGWQYMDGGDWFDLKGVTHWMPLPDAPKE